MATTVMTVEFGTIHHYSSQKENSEACLWSSLRGVEWVHDLFLFPLVLLKMKLPHAKLGLFCVV